VQGPAAVTFQGGPYLRGASIVKRLKIVEKQQREIAHLAHGERHSLAGQRFADLFALAMLAKTQNPYAHHHVVSHDSARHDSLRERDSPTGNRSAGLVTTAVGAHVHYLSYFELAELYLKDGIPEIFANGKGRKESDKDELIEELYKLEFPMLANRGGG
jgi:hypothetical protein